MYEVWSDAGVVFPHRASVNRAVDAARVKCPPLVVCFMYVETSTMRVGRFATRFRYSMVGVLMLVSAWPSRAQAQDGHDHLVASTHHEQTPAQKRRANALVAAVREATAGFQDPAAAEYQHYFLNFGCVSGGDFGAMGIHFVNMDRWTAR